MNEWKREREKERKRKKRKRRAFLWLAKWPWPNFRSNIQIVVRNLLRITLLAGIKVAQKKGLWVPNLEKMSSSPRQSRQPSFPFWKRSINEQSVLEKMSSSQSRQPSFPFWKRSINANLSVASVVLPDCPRSRSHRCRRSPVEDKIPFCARGVD